MIKSQNAAEILLWQWIFLLKPLVMSAAIALF